MKSESRGNKRAVVKTTCSPAVRCDSGTAPTRRTDDHGCNALGILQIERGVSAGKGIVPEPFRGVWQSALGKFLKGVRTSQSGRSVTVGIAGRGVRPPSYYHLLTPSLAGDSLVPSNKPRQVLMPFSIRLDRRFPLH